MKPVPSVTAFILALVLGLQSSALAQAPQSPVLKITPSVTEPVPVTIPPTSAEPSLTEHLPEGTLGPVTLKSTLQKTRELPLTLENALHLAEGKNISLQTETVNEAVSRAEYLYRLSDLLPDVSLEYRQSRFVGVTQVFGGETVSVRRTTYQPQLTLNYSIYTAGQNIFEIRASRQRAEAQAHQVESTRQDVLAQVAVAYYNLQQAYWQRAITLRAIEEAEVEVSLNEARLANGIGVRLNVLQAQTLLSSRKTDLVDAENQISIASQHLSQLLDMDFDVDILPPALESNIVRLVPDEMTFTKMLATMKIRNPRLQTLYKLRDAQNTDVKVAFASLFPQIDITAYVNGTGPQIDSLGLTRFAGIAASTNLLDNLGVGSLIAVKTAKSQRKLGELAIEQAESLLQESLANNQVQLKTNAQKIELAKDTLNTATQAYNHALGRLKEGVGTNLDLENTMVELTQARSNLANAFLDYNKTQVLLLSNLGLVSASTLTQGYHP